MNKMIPAKKDAEIGFISRLLLKPSQMSTVVDRVRPEHFYYDETATIYEAMRAVYLRGKMPTVPNVADELVKRELRTEGPEQVEWELQRYKHDIEDRVHGTLEDYADLIIQAAKNRRLIDAAKQIADAAYHEDDGSVELAEQLILAIAMDSSQVEASSMPDMLDRYRQGLDQRMTDFKQGRPHGVRTGFRDVDKMLLLRPGTLNLLGALTSVGKTAFALNVAFNIIKHSGGRVLFFSLEMSEDELMQRFLAMEAHCDQTRYRDGDVTPGEYEEALEAIEQLRPLDFHATDKAFRLDQIKSVARAMHLRKPLDLIVVDYLQMVDVPPAERAGRQKAAYEEMGDISKGLKRLAQELHVPVLALAQLAKDAARGEKPDLSHIAGAYQIARDADTSALLYVKQEEMDKRNACQPYAVNFLVAKERNGRVGETSVMFIPAQTRFADTEY